MKALCLIYLYNNKNTKLCLYLAVKGGSDTECDGSNERKASENTCMYFLNGDSNVDKNITKTR